MENNGLMMAKSQEPRAKSQEERKGERTGVAILILCLFFDFVLFAQAADDTTLLVRNCKQELQGASPEADLLRLLELRD